MAHDTNTFKLDPAAAAALLGLTPPALAGLVAAGYLAAQPETEGRLSFELADLKAFVARNADNGAGAHLLDSVVEPDSPELEPAELLDLLDQRADQMARRLLKMFATVFPDAGAWDDTRQGAFVHRARESFESVMAVVGLGIETDPDLYQDMRTIGTNAGRTGVPLRDLLVIVRIARDLVVQNAVDLAENGARHGGLALSLLLTRILPAMDRLSDALAEGYWEALSGT